MAIVKQSHIIHPLDKDRYRTTRGLDMALD